MQVCECSGFKVRPETDKYGNKFCATCGHYWMPEYGSRRPGELGKAGNPNQAESSKSQRNGPCICGSGKKYKKCCLGKGEAR